MAEHAPTVHRAFRYAPPGGFSARVYAGTRPAVSATKSLVVYPPRDERKRAGTMAQRGVTMEPAGLQIGALFGRYEIVRLVASGPMGSVYEATHVDLKKRVALKALAPALAGDADARARFLREGEAASRVKHPHVVDVTDTGVHEGVPFMVMEYLEGEDLAAVLRREKSLPLPRLVDLLLPICAAVLAAHEAGIVHRDIKPSNILLARSRLVGTQPKLLDFGVSRLDDGASEGGLPALVGTPSYMAPEQVGDVPVVDARTDQYALGVILYEASTGVLPFERATLQELFKAIAEESVAPLRRHRPVLPEGFESAVLRAMARSPAERFPSVRDLGAAILPFASAAGQAMWNDVFGIGDEPLGMPQTQTSAALRDPTLSQPPMDPLQRFSATSTLPGLASASPREAPAQPSAPREPTPAPSSPTVVPTPVVSIIAHDDPSADDDLPVVPTHSLHPAAYVAAAILVVVAAVFGMRHHHVETIHRAPRPPHGIPQPQIPEVTAPPPAVVSPPAVVPPPLVVPTLPHDGPPRLAVPTSVPRVHESTAPVVHRGHRGGGGTPNGAPILE